MSVHNPRSGNVNNNIGSILNAGTPAKSTFNSLSLSTNSTEHNSPRSTHSATQNIGTTVPYSGADYSYDYQPTADQWIGKVIGTSIGGVNNNILRGGDSGQRDLVNQSKQYERLNITSWSATDGSATKGAQEGEVILSSGIDGSVVNPDHGTRGRGEFSYLVTGKVPTQADF